MISVVMPLYNKEVSVGRAILSVLQQTFSHFELIVVDDGSTDGSLGQAKQFSDDRIVILQMQKNSGVSAARNTGINQAKYDHVAFIDADDIWNKQFLEEIHAAIVIYPNAEWYGTNWTDINAKDNLDNFTVSDADKSQYVDYCKLSVYRTIINASSFVVKKKVLSDVGGFTDGVKIFEDQELFCKLAQRGSLVYVDKVLSYYVKDSENRACSNRAVQELPPYFEQQLVAASHNYNPEAAEYWCKEFIINKVLSEMSLAMQTSGERVRGIKLLYLCRSTHLQRGRYLKGWLYSLLPPFAIRKLVKVSSKRGLKGA